MREIFPNSIEKTLRKRWDEDVLESYISHKTITGHALASTVITMIDFWQNLGISAESKIAICIPSGTKWAELFISIICSRYVAVALPGDLESAIVAAQHSDCDVLYVQPSSLKLIDTHLFPYLKYIISADDNTVLWCSENSSAYYNPIPLLRSRDFRITRHNPNDLALIIYTSGTTSHTKGVMLSFKNLNACLSSSVPHLPYAKDESYLTLLPFNHIFGLTYDLLAPICSGMKLVILDVPPIPEFIIPALRAIRPRMLMSVPAVFYKLIEEIDRLDDWKILKPCKMIICGGAGVQKSFSDLMVKEKRLPFFIGYGMSECSPVICLPTMGDYEIYSCGRPVECLHFRIDSEDPFHIPGEIQVKGDSVFMGYYNNPSLTHEVFTQDGWFKTADWALLSERGNVFLCGRKDSQLSVGSGKNIYIDDIEEQLRTCEYIKDVIVLYEGSILKAIIVPQESEYEKDIRVFVANYNKQLSGIYISEILFENKIERTEKGTIKRHLYNHNHSAPK